MQLMGTGGEGGTDPVQKNTVFFDQVRVPAFSLVGGENNGWKAATTHLELEHGAGGRIGRHRVWDRLLRYCQETKRDGIPLAQQGDTRDLLADIYIKTEVMRLFGLRNFWLGHEVHQPLRILNRHVLAELVPAFVAAHPVHALHVLMGGGIIRRQRLAIGIGEVGEPAAGIGLDRQPRQIPAGILRLLHQEVV